MTDATVLAKQSTDFVAERCLELRSTGALPTGKCLYIQSGDPGDFDGYLIAIAGTELQQRNSDFEFAIVVPERRACPDREEEDVNKHDDAFSEQVMHTAGRLARLLCPQAMLVRGPLNVRNVIPLKFIFSEPEQYGPLLAQHPNGESIFWRSVKDLALLVENETVSSVILDMNGSLGYLHMLYKTCPSLGRKLKASGMPISVMAGVLAESESKTLRVPGRDPRSTMNALYDAAAVRLMLSMASEHDIPLVFVTNNVCYELLCFQDAGELSEGLGLQGLLRAMAMQWYGPHLEGKCVPFDWVSFCAMLLYRRWSKFLTLEKRHLYVGNDDPSVLVLLDPDLLRTKIVEAQVANTTFWGEVESVVTVDRDAMLSLVRTVAASHVL